ncbi:MAG: PilZ domain-containing protein [Lachnospiraceae bacterium]|nr:PilZ domain-containing protein [Lachnospiraceae bacterium]
MEEKRRSKRMDIDVKISLRAIEGDGTAGRSYEVEVMNISRGGMAFKCLEELSIKGFYDTQITIWTKERINTVIQVLHKDGDVYGGKFVGMAAPDQFKIEVYELFNYPGEEQNK